MSNEDLKLIQMQMDEAERQAASNVPAIAFDKPPVVAQSPTDKAQELVEQAFDQAIVHRVSTNKEVQEELLQSADKVIHNKMSAVKSRADQEDKEAHFNNKKGACECFGYNEATTEKWAVNAMNVWHNIATALWILIGCFTFAPVTFVAKKIVVIFKKTWLAVLFALIIYLVVLALPFVVSYLTKLNII